MGKSVVEGRGAVFEFTWIRSVGRVDFSWRPLVASFLLLMAAIGGFFSITRLLASSSLEAGARKGGGVPRCRGRFLRGPGRIVRVSAGCTTHVSDNCDTLAQRYSIESILFYSTLSFGRNIEFRLKFQYAESHHYLCECLLEPNNLCAVFGVKMC